MLAALAASVLFLALNGFFVGAEFAFVKLRSTQLNPRARRGEPAAIAAQVVLRRLDRYLSVTQFGITLSSLGLGWLGEPTVEKLLRQTIWHFVPDHTLGHIEQLVLVIASFASLTFAHVLFGELVPKLVAIQRSEGTALAAAIPLRAVYVMFLPLLWVLERSSRLVLRGMGMKPDVTSEGALSAEEIVGILAANTALGPSGKESSELVERVLRVAQRTARHAMVPRVDVMSLPIDTPAAGAIEAVRAHQYSRILLTKGRSLDEVVGYLYAKDLVLDEGAHRLSSLSSLRRDILFVPETQRLVQAMRDMQKQMRPIAVVVDEYGGTSGILTLEDILEEIVGDIRDESDEEPARITALSGEAETWEVDGRTTMEELKALGVAVREDEAAEPLGAVILSRLGRLARLGDTVTLGPGATAQVVALQRRRVARVRVRLRAPTSEES